MKLSNRMLTVILIGLAAGMIVVGMVRDEPQNVLTKAVQICFECIGIG